MSTVKQAIFISYASEDAEAAGRIAHGLRTSGREVWFDKSELKGGEEWDLQIRRRINDCRLFLAVVSTNTQARDEGYFRREWKLAVNRTRDMAEGRAFIVPVVIDNTSERLASVPDWFREIQWVRLPQGEPTPAFCQLIESLLDSSGQHDPTPATPEMTLGTHKLPRSIRTRIFGLFAALLLIVASAAGWWASTRSSQPVGPIADQSLAVLPFIDLSESPGQGFLADGMAEEILDLLARIPRLTVISRTSSFQFKGKSEDLRAVGAKLGAAYLVEGSVRTSGSRVRVTAQLIDAHSGSRVWSESYEREFKDVLEVQDQVATSIARELQLAVNSANVASHDILHNPEAYTLYLRGRVAFDRGDVSAFREAGADFERALALEPSLTRAAEGLLLVELNLVYSQQIAAAVGWPRVQQLAEATLRQDPGSVFAHSALGWVHAYYDHDLVGCNREVDAILASSVRDPVALVYSAWIASIAGRPDVAEQMARQAIVSDPLSPDPYQVLGAILRDAGDFAASERAFRQSIAISPSFGSNHVYLAEVLYYENKLTEALVAVTGEDQGTARQAVLAGIKFGLGQSQESDELLTDLIPKLGVGDAYWMAVTYSMRHDRDHAFDWLDKAFASDDLSLHIIVDPIFAPLRDDPRWRAVVAKLSRPRNKDPGH